MNDTTTMPVQEDLPFLTRSELSTVVKWSAPLGLLTMAAVVAVAMTLAPTQQPSQAAAALLPAPTPQAVTPPPRVLVQTVSQPVPTVIVHTRVVDRPVPIPLATPPPTAAAAPAPVTREHAKTTPPTSSSTRSVPPSRDDQVEDTHQPGKTPGDHE